MGRYCQTGVAAACAGGVAMDSGLQYLTTIVAIFNSGDLSEVDAIFAADYVDHQRPAGLNLDGPDEFKQIVRGARDGLRNLKVTIVDTVADESKVAARLHWEGTTATGQHIERETIELLHVRNGKVAEYWGAEAWLNYV